MSYRDGDQTCHYDFDAGEVVIGRSPKCNICPRDFGISRRHARVSVGDDGPRLIDLQSKNGSQINGVSVLQAPPESGDRIRLGRFELTFTLRLESQVLLDEAEPVEPSGTIVRHVSDISKLLPWPSRRAARRGTSPPRFARLTVPTGSSGS